MEKKPRCYNCKFFTKQDIGYSNWTVEGTDITCLKDVFETIEESYSRRQSKSNPENDSEFFKQAETCPYFKEGDGACFDADGEVTVEDFKEDDELYKLLKEKGYGNGEKFNRYGVCSRKMIWRCYCLLAKHTISVLAV